MKFPPGNWRLIFIVGAAPLLWSCAGSAHPHAIRTNEVLRAPGAIELQTETRVTTLHFSAGTYVLDATDAIGFYYRAPHGVIQHMANGSVVRRGGIFLSKRDRKKLRGYVYHAGAVTHVGDFSRTPHAFRD